MGSQWGQVLLTSLLNLYAIRIPKVSLKVLCYRKKGEGFIAKKKKKNKFDRDLSCYGKGHR